MPRGRRRILGAGLEGFGRLGAGRVVHRLVLLDELLQVLPLVDSRRVEADPLGDELGGASVHPNSVDADRAHVIRHRSGAARQAKTGVGRGVVADEEHELQKVSDREAHPGVVQQAADHSASRRKIARLDRDHLIQAEPPLVDEMQQSDGNRHLVGAGHGKSLVAIQVGATLGLQMIDGDPHGAP